MPETVNADSLQQACSAADLQESCRGKTGAELRGHLAAMSAWNLMRLYAHAHGPLREAARRAMKRRRQNDGTEP